MKSMEQIKERARELDLLMVVVEGTIIFKHKYQSLSINVGNKYIVANIDNTLIGTGIKVIGQALIDLYDLAKDTQELINANPNILKGEL